MVTIVNKLVFTVIAATGFSVIGVLPIPAQLPMSNGRTSDRDNSSERELEQAVAQMRYLIFLADKRKPNRKVDPKLALEQLQEDLSRLQIINKELVLKSQRSDALDLKFISKSAEEIQKRAERLLSNLALPEPEAGAVPDKTGAISDLNHLMKAITAMGWLIYWFTKNPIFKEVDVIDVAPSTKARADLEQMVGLSIEMKKSAELLRKTSGK